MNPIDSVVQAVLYEGYMLYPYRSSVKNRQRGTFGGVYPHAYAQTSGSDPWMMQTECLMRGGARTRIVVRPGFLQLIDRTVLAGAGRGDANPESVVPMLDVDDRRYYPWQEAAEQQIGIPAIRVGELLDASRNIPFSFEGGSELEALADRHGTICGALRRTRFNLQGRVELAIAPVADGAYRLTVRILNVTPLNDAATLTRDTASLHALTSCYITLRVAGGEFVSQSDPPAELAAAADACNNIGVWPVLVGHSGTYDTMLASPIILSDYPQRSPEGLSDRFDATEIDEILTLPILTPTCDEKRERAATGERARVLPAHPERRDAQQTQKLYGTLRHVRPLAGGVAFPAFQQEAMFAAVSPWTDLDARAHLACVRVAGVEIRVGDRVRLHPRARADIFDIALTGMVATIASIERDFDDRVHVAVTIDSDPGKNLGMERVRRHRFFFAPDEIEPLHGSGRQG